MATLRLFADQGDFATHRFDLDAQEALKDPSYSEYWGKRSVGWSITEGSEAVTIYFRDGSLVTIPDSEVADAGDVVDTKAGRTPRETRLGATRSTQVV